MSQSSLWGSGILLEVSAFPNSGSSDGNPFSSTICFERPEHFSFIKSSSIPTSRLLVMRISFHNHLLIIDWPWTKDELHFRLRFGISPRITTKPFSSKCGFLVLTRPSAEANMITVYPASQSHGWCNKSMTIPTCSWMWAISVE